MVENNRFHNRTNQIEDDYHKVSDKESQVAVAAQERTRRGSTPCRFRTIEYRESSLHTRNRQEKSVSARNEKDRG